MTLSPKTTLAQSTFTLPVHHQPGVGAQAAHWVFSIPQQVKDSVTRQGTVKPSLLGRALQTIMNRIGDFDHCEQAVVKIWKWQLKLTVPSQGAFFLIVIPFCVIPRVYQAFNREDNRFKWVELGDIVRRDMLTLFSLLYALEPFQKWMTRKAGNARGITLNDPLSGHIYQSGDTARLYTLGQHGDVERILKPMDGSIRGLVTEKALKQHYQKALTTLEGWMSNKTKAIVDNAALAHTKVAVQQLKQALHPLGGSATLDTPTLTKLDRSLVDGIHAVEKHLAPWADEAPKLRNVLAHAADATRTPVSVVSFLLVCGLIGVAPDVFNKLWNQRRFARLKQEGLQAHGEAVLARLQPSTQRLKPFLG
ncbi:MAG: hypothetical protein QE263_02690 [Vampirovibrionales bacterium]|nr:hypothetical protein [Vampirovibrionales bacterium]